MPDASEVVETKAPRPLPKDRTRAVAKSGEVDAKKGLLTQTQLTAFLERWVGGWVDSTELLARFSGMAAHLRWVSCLRPDVYLFTSSGCRVFDLVAFFFFFLSFVPYSP